MVVVDRRSFEALGYYWRFDPNYVTSCLFQHIRVCYPALDELGLHFFTHYLEHFAPLREFGPPLLG